MKYELIAPRTCSSSIEQVLVNRGIKLEEIPHYLNTTDNDLLNPLLLDNIQEAAKMLVRHIKSGSKVFIQVDSDVDGLTSSAVLMNYLNEIVPAFVQSNVTYRLHDGKQHGIILESIGDDIKLVIAPDASSNDYEVHEALAARGIDVLVLDHHEAERVSEYACVVNNQLCDYPNKSLSGVGVVYKFCSYLDTLLGSSCGRRFEDLVALGLVADMMSLREFETRHLITLGIKNINNPFFKAMVEKQAYGLGETVTPIGLAFYIAPYMNAICRSGTAEEKRLIFEAMLEFRAYEMLPSTKRGCKGQFETRVEQACRTCTNVKNRQTRSRDQSTEIIERLIQEQNLLENKILVIQLDKQHSIDVNLTGLIANRLMAEYQRPVMLLNEVEEEGKTFWRGSCRGYDKSALKDFRGFLEESGLVEYAQGHANAFGASVTDENFNELINYSNEKLKDFDFTPKYDVDLIFNFDDINDYDVRDIASYKHLWGQMVDEPFIAIENVPVYAENLKLMKGTTLKIETPTMELIKFGSSDEEYESLYSKLGCVIINVVGRCEINSWNNKPQICIEDYEIIKKQQYYF